MTLLQSFDKITDIFAAPKTRKRISNNISKLFNSNVKDLFSPTKNIDNSIGAENG